MLDEFEEALAILDRERLTVRFDVERFTVRKCPFQGLACRVGGNIRLVPSRDREGAGVCAAGRVLARGCIIAGQRFL